jgi:hypothetical protein
VGNTSAQYDSLEEAPLRDRFWSLPKRVSEERWVEIVETVCRRNEKLLLDRYVAGCLRSYDRPDSPIPKTEPDRDAYAESMRRYFSEKATLEAATEREIALAEDVVPIQNGERILEDSEAACVLMQYVASECNARSLHTYDIIHDLWCDSPIDIHLRNEKAKRDTWDRFLAAIGYPACPEPLPWWLNAAYPEGHHLAVIPSDKCRALTQEIRMHRLDELAAKTLDKGVCAVLAFLAKAGEENRTIIAVESAS